MKDSSNLQSCVANLAWAEQQKCGSPLEKLLLITSVGRIAPSGQSNVEYGDLAEFCCCSVAEVSDAIDDLCRRRLLWILAGNSTSAELAMPWWKAGDTAISDEGAYFPWPIREVLSTAQEGKCWYCGIDLDNHPQTPHLEHQVPISRGGPDKISNLVLACAPCNTSKNARTVSEYRKFVIARDRKPRDYRFYWESRE